MNHGMVEWRRVFRFACDGALKPDLGRIDRAAVRGRKNREILDLRE
jgi:hypothetical protein